MSDLEEYEKHLSRMGYKELCAERKQLELALEEYEAGIPEDDPRWKNEEDPDVVYYRTLRHMGMLFSFLSDGYLREMEKNVLAYSRRVTSVKLDYDEEETDKL